MTDQIYPIRKKIIAACRESVTKALLIANEWIASQPEEANAWSMRAYVHAYAKDYDKALLDIGEAIKLAPDEPSHLFDKSRYAINFFDYEVAIESLTCAIRKGQNYNFHYYESTCYLFRALCFCKIGQFEKAEADLDNVEDEQPFWIDKLRSKPDLLLACRLRTID